MGILRDKANRIVLNYIYANCPLIKNVEPGECRFNHRCADNAVHEAIKNEESYIVMCFYIEDGYPMIHFINVNSIGLHKDNTLGHWTKQYEYRFVRFIGLDEYFDVHKIFFAFRKEIKKMLPFYIRWFIDCDY